MNASLSSAASFDSGGLAKPGSARRTPEGLDIDGRALAEGADALLRAAF